MKKAIFQSSKAIKLVNIIIETEDLDLTVTTDIKTALGDTVIEVEGEAEDVKIFMDVYNMAK